MPREPLADRASDKTMPPFLALFCWAVMLVTVLHFEPVLTARPSRALWVPVIWLFFLGSRSPSQWFGEQVTASAAAFEDGNPLNRITTVVLLLLALGILVSRSFDWRKFLSLNLALTAFVGFALISFCWSDFPLVALKRWVRDFGSYMVMLVILTDRRPTDAVRIVLRRLSYLLVPLSIVFNKYYPGLSKQYDPFSGFGYYIGVATSKNMLGLLCLISGLFFFWDTAIRWEDRRLRRTRRILLLNGAFFAMTLWLLYTAKSTTSSICLILGCLAIAAAYSKVFRRRPGLLKGLIPVAFLVYLLLSLGLGMRGSLAEAVGKDPTLTDRTKIWGFLLGMHTNPIIGVGYQSFWVGPRLQWFWQNAGLGHLNEAHNGYLEVYLQLGLIGVVLLAIFLVSSYRRACRRLNSDFNLAVFGMAIWMVVLFYNLSEAAYEAGLLYTIFLLGILAVPSGARVQVRKAASQNDDAIEGSMQNLPLKPAALREAR